MHMDRLVIEHGSAWGRRTVNGQPVPRLEFRERTKGCHGPKDFALDAENHGVSRVTQCGRAGGNRLEYYAQVCW